MSAAQKTDDEVVVEPTSTDEPRLWHLPADALQDGLAELGLEWITKCGLRGKASPTAGGPGLPGFLLAPIERCAVCTELDLSEADR